MTTEERWHLHPPLSTPTSSSGKEATSPRPLLTLGVRAPAHRHSPRRRTMLLHAVPPFPSCPPECVAGNLCTAEANQHRRRAVLCPAPAWTLSVSRRRWRPGQHSSEEKHRSGIRLHWRGGNVCRRWKVKCFSKMWLCELWPTCSVAWSVILGTKRLEVRFPVRVTM